MDVGMTLGSFVITDDPALNRLVQEDAVEVYTINAVNGFLDQRKNSNGCVPKSTYFVSIKSVRWFLGPGCEKFKPLVHSYTNFSMVTDLYVGDNEVADNTMAHVGAPPNDEITGNLLALNAFSGIPLSALAGFRAPFLNYTVDTLTQLHSAGFTVRL